MGHLRISERVLRQRSEEQQGPFAKYEKNYAYLFTQSKWHAISYIGEGRLVLEDLEIDARTVFPWRVMRGVDYGVKRGLHASTMQYTFAEQHRAGVGAVLTLRDQSGRELGHYAIRYHNEHEKPTGVDGPH